MKDNRKLYGELNIYLKIDDKNKKGTLIQAFFQNYFNQIKKLFYAFLKNQKKISYIHINLKQ